MVRYSVKSLKTLSTRRRLLLVARNEKTSKTRLTRWNFVFRMPTGGLVRPVNAQRRFTGIQKRPRSTGVITANARRDTERSLCSLVFIIIYSVVILLVLRFC